MKAVTKEQKARSLGVKLSKDGMTKLTKESIRKMESNRLYAWLHARGYSWNTSKQKFTKDEAHQLT